MCFGRLILSSASFATRLLTLALLAAVAFDVRSGCVPGGAATNCLSGGSVMLVSLADSVVIFQGVTTNLAVAPVVIPGQSVVTTSYTNSTDQVGGPLPPWANGLFAFLIFVTGIFLIKNKALGKSAQFWCWFAVITTASLASSNALAQTCPATSVTNATLPLILSTNWTVNGPGNFTASGSGCNAIFSTTNLGSGTATYTAIWQSSCDQSLNTNSTSVVFYVVAPFVSSDGQGTPDPWYSQNGIDPSITGVPSQDPDQDGLSNSQEYLYGTQPLVSEGFAVWTADNFSNVP